jgi:hypothetical protein
VLLPVKAHPTGEITLLRTIHVLKNRKTLYGNPFEDVLDPLFGEKPERVTKTEF